MPVAKLNGPNTYYDNNHISTHISAPNPSCADRVFSCFAAAPLTIMSIAFVMECAACAVAMHYLENGAMGWYTIWFSVVTTSSVGYGDYYPESNEGKIFVGFYIIFSMGIWAFMMSAFVAYLFKEDLASDADFFFDRVTDKKELPWWKCHRDCTRREMEFFGGIIWLLIMFGLCGLSAHFLMIGDLTFIDGLYFAAVTLSSVGYGDYYPTSDRGIVLGTVFIVFGCPIFGFCIAKIVMYPFESNALRLQKKRLEHSLYGAEWIGEDEGGAEEQRLMHELFSADAPMKTSLFVALVLVDSGKVSPEYYRDLQDKYKELIDEVTELRREEQGTELRKSETKLKEVNKMTISEFRLMWQELHDKKYGSRKSAATKKTD